MYFRQGCIFVESYKENCYLASVNPEFGTTQHQNQGHVSATSLLDLIEFGFAVHKSSELGCTKNNCHDYFGRTHRYGH